MKMTTLLATALVLNLSTPAARAQESSPALPPAKCEMCEMMKKKAAANSQVNEQIAELDKLVTEMNGSLGPRKIEAMAAVITRLVGQYKLMIVAKTAAPAAPPATPPKAEAHQH